MTQQKKTTSSSWHDANWFLIYCAFIFAWGDILFGIDTGSFGAIQALPSFLRDFGTKGDDGTYSMSTRRVSIMNSSKPHAPLGRPI
jgi:hypothetical protein